MEKVLDSVQEAFYRKQLLEFMDFMNAEADRDDVTHDSLTPEQAERFETFVNRYGNSDLREMLNAAMRLRQEVKEVGLIIMLLQLKAVLQDVKDARDEEAGK